MSHWLDDGLVLEGEGSGEAVPPSPRQRTLPPGSPMPSRVRSPLASPSAREATSGSPQTETMGKARELFVLCDKEGKGFITKRDMQRLQGELPLSPEQLEEVFESLDRQSNGFLTPAEFNTGLGELVGPNEATELDGGGGENGTRASESQDPAALRLMDVMTELGADKVFKDQEQFCSLWYDLQKDRPELLGILEGILVHAVSHLQDSTRERHSLEQALRRRENEHDQVIRSIYEDMESQIREERDKRQSQESVRQKQIGKLEEELKMREQELENMLSRQRELDSRVQQLSSEQADVRLQNQQLRSLNTQLQQQLEGGREQLQATRAQLRLLEHNAAQEQDDRQRNVLRVSRNIQKEKESLMRQLDLLRDMNRRLRDEKDAQQSQRRTPKVSTPLQKKGSIVGHYFLQDKPIKRQLNSADESEQDSEATSASKRWQPSGSDRCDSVEVQTQSSSVGGQRLFKVMFLGNSGVGKTSFIQHYCTGRSNSKIRATVGIDFQMKTLRLGSTDVTLQLWDTAGQERFRSISEQYYRKAEGILAMYDLTDVSSFTAVRGWMDSVKEKAGDGVVLMLLANKLDQADSQRAVTALQGQKLAELNAAGQPAGCLFLQQHQALFFECSAQSGSNLEELMVEMARMLVSQHDRQCEDVLTLTNNTERRSCCT